jgi:hypothetical protein
LNFAQCGLLGADMTLQELKEHERGLNELAFREAIQDMREHYGKERLLEIIKVELKHIGIEIASNGQR